jgi:hypothetical protein
MAGAARGRHSRVVTDRHRDHQVGRPRDNRSLADGSGGKGRFLSLEKPKDRFLVRRYPRRPAKTFFAFGQGCKGPVQHHIRRHGAASPAIGWALEGRRLAKRKILAQLVAADPEPRDPVVIGNLKRLLNGRRNAARTGMLFAGAGEIIHAFFWLCSADTRCCDGREIALYCKDHSRAKHR